MINKPKLIIQIDCDSETVIKKHYNLLKDINYSYYSSLGCFLSKFEEYRLRSTLFVVGQDVNCYNKAYLRWAVENGHELANHSFTHPVSFSDMTTDEIKIEIRKTNDIIFNELGCVCRGFRAPNFDINFSIFSILENEGLQYDCSILETPYNSVLKLIKKHDANVGYYLPSKDSKGIDLLIQGMNNINVVEIPISTFPYLKFPCHFSYLLALNRHIAQRIIDLLIDWHVRTNTPLVYLFHLADIVDNEHLYGTELKMYKSRMERLFLLDYILKKFSIYFESIISADFFELMKNGDKK